MKRDLDLIREILISVESLDNPKLDIPIKGFDQLIVNEHVYLCSQAGLLEATVLRDSRGLAAQAVVSRLTWQGHEFLQLARDKQLWSKAKLTFKDKAVSFTFEMLFLYLKQEAVRLLPS